MKALIQPTYFPDIISTAAMLQAKSVILEVCDNYQKQSYRNRMYIGTANGSLLLNIPVKHTGTGNHKKTADALIENNFNWQRQHWRSLVIAYSTSPFFEFYEDELHPLFHTKHKRLIDLNKATINCIFTMLDHEIQFEETSEYIKDPSACNDLRFLANAKRKPDIELSRYRQVFEESNGFVPYLSVLDLIFNLGPESLDYLSKIDLKIDNSL